MLKTILNLKGAQQLSKNDQQSINGGMPTYVQPFIGSGCRPTCPQNCGLLGGECVPCTDGAMSGFECKIG